MIQQILLVIIIVSILAISLWVNVSASHFSKPIVALNKTTFQINEPLVIEGWVDYIGSPISDVLLDVMLRTLNGSIVSREEVASDSNGTFVINLKLRDNLIPGIYTVYIISACRDEHRNFCANQDILVPIEIIQGDKIIKKPLNVVDTTNNTKSARLDTMARLQVLQSSKSGQNVTCAGQNTTTLGTPHIDILTGNGSNKEDIIHGMGGNDTIYITYGRNHILCGGGESDMIIDNGSGNDTIYGGVGNDFIKVASSNNIIAGEQGTDIIAITGEGKNWIYGGNGNDMIIDNGSGNDTIYGGVGNDTIYSHKGGNVLHGGYSDDVMFGISADKNDTIHGEEGYDTIYGGRDKGIINGGPGFDKCFNGILVQNCEE